MRSDTRFKHIWNRYNALRGYTVQSELPVALFLLKKTKEEFVSNSKNLLSTKLMRRCFQ